MQQLLNKSPVRYSFQLYLNRNIPVLILASSHSQACFIIWYLMSFSFTKSKYYSSYISNLVTFYYGLSTMLELKNFFVVFVNLILVDLTLLPTHNANDVNAQKCRYIYSCIIAYAHVWLTMCSLFVCKVASMC